ncbi:glycosyltransferase family 2 protein [Weissella sp. MSCH1]|uniref:glycosyltransferase family 2 protein n=1 Tax=Weissella sp. MSCH1 TaxID=3383343 RepID=UPI003896B08E
MRNDDLKFSIILAVYNAEYFIERTIQSFISCGFRHSEMIIIDDGSTDRTLQICRKYQYSDQIRVIKQSHHGLGYSRNAGIDLAYGEYILFLDGDDTLNNSIFYRLSNNLNGHDVVYFNWKKLKGDVVSLVNGIDAKKTIAVWNKCYKRSFILENGLKFPENSKFEDVGYSLRALMLSDSNGYIDGDALYNYSVRFDSASHASASPRDRLEVLHNLEKLKCEFLGVVTDKENLNLIDQYIYDCWRFQFRGLLVHFNDEAQYVAKLYVKFLESYRSNQKNSFIKRYMDVVKYKSIFTIISFLNNELLIVKRICKAFV